jgi:hypothetical protein
VRRAPLAPSLLLLLATACATPRPVRPLPVGDARPESLLGALERDSAARRALRGVARLSLEGPTGSGRAKQVLVVERPAHLRVEILGFLNQTVAVLTTDGTTYRLFRSEDHSLTEGPVHPGLLWEVAGIALTPEQAVRVLLGVPVPPPGARIEGGALLPEGGVRVQLSLPDSTSRLEIEFDADGHLSRWNVVDPDGQSLWEARFADYRPVEGGVFAHDIEVRDRLNGTEAHVSFGEIELNPTLDPDVFTLRLGDVG